MPFTFPYSSNSYIFSPTSTLFHHFSSPLLYSTSQERGGRGGGLEMAGCNGDSPASKGASLEKKYGGIVPRKKPLISKDNERAYFDSADWALGKQGNNMGDKTRAAVETLRPKLERTPPHQLPPRRPACITGGENRA